MDRIEQLREKRAKIHAGGGQKNIEAQHRKGKLTARERLNLLFDEGTFVELDTFVRHRSTDFGMDKKEIPGEGVVTGYGRVYGGWSMPLPRLLPFRGSLGNTMPKKSSGTGERPYKRLSCYRC